MAEPKKPAPEPASANPEPKPPEVRLVPKHGFRDMVESVVMAFALAFLFRTFEAEAFVIPTGSMGPTLRGRHRDVECLKCGNAFAVGASDEIDQSTGRSLVGHDLRTCVCPVCRYHVDVSPTNSAGASYPSYSGDRILVNKFAYELGEPERFDVAVFHYPLRAKTNYIKRIVGLPRETLRISQGDLFVRGENEQEFTIARKPPRKQRALWQEVWDNDRLVRLRSEVERGFPTRWTPEGGADGWTAADDLVTFQIEAAGPAEKWLRYRHRVLTTREWDRLSFGSLPADVAIPPQLITDTAGYNSGVSLARGDVSVTALGVHWVGDLALECSVELTGGPSTGGQQGEFALELAEGTRSYQARFAADTGQATLWIGDAAGDRKLLATSASPTALRAGNGARSVSFSNFDDELLLWVDGKAVAFDQETRYAWRDSQTPLAPTARDLLPAGIAARGVAARVQKVRLYRDLYYTCSNRQHAEELMMTDFGTLPSASILPHQLQSGSREEDLRLLLSQPNYFDEYRNLLLQKGLEFTLGPDQFFALGDNSTHSSDSRVWGAGIHWIDRKYLIGKAFLIYWPHPWAVSLGGYDLPVFPNFGRMIRIR